MKEQNEKQAIEEMAKVMHEKNREIAQDCCGIEKLIAAGKSLPDAYAEALYNEGYRKQSVGEWVWADDGYCRCSVCAQKAPVTTQYQDEPMTTATKYCPNCCARMKGGEE